MASLTNVWFPPDKTELLHEAIEHYNFDGPAAFFRICGLMLIKHYEQGDTLILPLDLTTLYASPKPQKTKTKT